MTWIDFLRIYLLAGGGVGVLFTLPLHLLLVATLAVAFRQTLALRRRRLIPREIETLLGERRRNEAARCAAASDSALGDILAEAQTGSQDVAIERQRMMLTYDVSWLALFGQFAPIIGLFGTVNGFLMWFVQGFQVT